MNRITNLFGALLLICFAQANSASAQYTLNTLFSFGTGGYSGPDGLDPNAGLIADASGNLYGMTAFAGTGGFGTVFKLAASTHALSTLAAFNGTDGDQPLSGLAVDASGNLYGTTSLGGNLTLNSGYGFGTVFEVAAGTNTISTLATFNGANEVYPNGVYPSCDLLVDASGNLFGTTQARGPNNGGTVFKVAAGTHTLSTLVAFNGTNGSSPSGGLIADAAGNLYGTTRNGGANNDGTVFKVAAGSNAVSTLATFSGANGANPYFGRLLADASGNLYGTTMNGGAYNYGTVFEVAAGTNALSTLVTFDSTNGAMPWGGLIADASGNLYGTTDRGGANNDGTVFEMAAGTHALSTLFSFDGTNGALPHCSLLADASGNLYGTTYDSGPNLGGTVFELSPVPEPPALALAACGLAALVLVRRCPASKSPPMSSRRSLLNCTEKSL